MLTTTGVDLKGQRALIGVGIISVKIKLQAKEKWCWTNVEMLQQAFCCRRQEIL